MIGDNEHLAWEELHKETRTLIRVLVDEIKKEDSLGVLLVAAGGAMVDEPLFVVDAVKEKAADEGLPLNDRITKALWRVEEASQAVRNTAAPDAEV